MSNVRNFIYISNPKHKLYGIGAFRICFKTNAGYMVRFNDEFHQVALTDGVEVALTDGVELPNVE